VSASPNKQRKKSEDFIIFTLMTLFQDWPFDISEALRVPQFTGRKDGMIDAHVSPNGKGPLLCCKGRRVKEITRR
jgi:hypothetical protein